MHIHQFYDEGLAHASYAIIDNGKMALVDPARDPQPYISYAKKHAADIVAVFETHPHADFASSHLEFHQTFGTIVYVHPDMGVTYPHQALSDQETVELGNLKIQALDTPGHSPDHNSYLLYDMNGKPHAIFTGDSLFIGDVGRPDLREDAGKFNLTRSELAGKMYETMQSVFKPLPDNVMVYPAHGAGSLCGKNMSDETVSSIGEQRKANWAFSETDKTAFVEELLSGQPNVPKYFPFSVEENRRGVPAYLSSLEKVTRVREAGDLKEEILIIDTRKAELYKKGHLDNSINIPDGEKFETWLGTLIAPGTPFYLVASSEDDLKTVMAKAAKISYEQFIAGIFELEKAPVNGKVKAASLDKIKAAPELYTILDVRSPKEHEQQPAFASSINVPLDQLLERAKQVGNGKPVAVHCAGGYRSAIAASILERAQQKEVLDIGDEIKRVLD
ncbi:MAG: MBL fold metallo-hydrolase [Phaeodactylibacter sp.]|uniref:MBL fold metallo-hydrolase n=1 Tax=Phaeodactylibacter sp. TaxID=1940289 RepID=UPI0032EE5D41